ncbi:aspartate aminotransferase family protein [Algisphaera agarilytica]|uniref:alanine--glyoxylate transaminase n=1 Tax=Algisphaera agarilytica TaxID=1385975 RepID=A0A7X0LJV4_9BACT|nr:aspartate aminotransferase family protein [Algisphaera agarilytica]MBB6428986.1 alanine-glyoxylate transaminase/(R)-3-amino-2-methylpropionate-pyruvate transaminase [Algisphaera agarilytica]
MTTLNTPGSNPGSNADPPRTIRLPQFDHQPAPYDGPTRDEVIALRHQYLSPGILTYYAEPMMIVEGKMQYVYDEKGTRYLDAFAGIVTVSVGHCHPSVIDKVKAQTDKLQHTTTIYLHPTIAQFAQKLASKMPQTSGTTGQPLDKTYFTNSGSEANEIAILSARETTGNHDVIALRNGYHGGTANTMGLTAHGTWRFKSNNPSGIAHTHPGYCYRCPYNLEYPSCDLKCAHDVKNVIEYQTSGEIAAFIGEPIQGVGGAVVPPAEYFQIVYDIVREHGGICIADEVQGGFGRTGTHYWAHQNFNVQPDMITMAKGIGNGAPLAAMTTTADISKTMANRVHFNTYGGNPISVTQGLATLEVIDEEGIQENALTVGTYLKDALLELQNKQPLIGEVRGLGLMLGVELVKDRTTKAPAKEECASIVEHAKTLGLLLGKGGLHGNTIRLKPPMCITQDDADFIVAVLDEALTAQNKH